MIASPLGVKPRIARMRRSAMFPSNRVLFLFSSSCSGSTKGYSSTYLAMGLADVRASTRLSLSPSLSLPLCIKGGRPLTRSGKSTPSKKRRSPFNSTRQCFAALHTLRGNTSLPFKLCKAILRVPLSSPRRRRTCTSSFIRWNSSRWRCAR